jgi:hypothetical protein
MRRILSMPAAVGGSIRFAAWADRTVHRSGAASRSSGIRETEALVSRVGRGHASDLADFGLVQIVV